MGKCIIQKVEYSKLRRVLYEWAESCLFKTSDRKKKIKIDGLTRRYLELVIPSFFGFCTLKHSRSGRLVNFMAIECSSIASMLRFYFINATVSMPQCSILNAKHFQNWRHSVRLWLYKGVLLHVMRMFSIWLAKFWMLSKMRCNIFAPLRHWMFLRFTFHSLMHSHVTHERVNLIPSSGCFLKHFKSFDDMKFGLCFARTYHVSNATEAHRTNHIQFA